MANFNMMSKEEALWFCLLLLGLGLIGAERGWQGVTWNVGLGIIGWVLGRITRTTK